MTRDEKEYRRLASAYLINHTNNIEILNAIATQQGVLVDMLEYLIKAKDKTTQQYKDGLNRWKMLHDSFKVLTKVQTDNELLKRALIVVENELAMYEMLHTK